MLKRVRRVRDTDRAGNSWRVRGRYTNTQPSVTHHATMCTPHALVLKEEQHERLLTQSYTITHLLGLGFLPLTLLDGHLQPQVVSPAQTLLLPITHHRHIITVNQVLWADGKWSLLNCGNLTPMSHQLQSCASWLELDTNQQHLEVVSGSSTLILH